MPNFKVTARAFFILTLVTISCNSKNPSATQMSKDVNKKLDTNEYDSTVFEHAFYQLNTEGTLSKNTIDSFSERIDTRADFYELLEKFGRQDLFPKEYLYFEKAAESRLSNWLEFPTELDAIPSKMELLQKVDYIENDSTFTYYVFEFKTDEPHWAAKDGWMIGVVGPYLKNSNPYDWASATFSRFSKKNETDPEKEAEWVHKNIYRKK